MRKANKNQYAKQPRASNEKFMKNLRTKLTDHETVLLAKGLKFASTSPVPASHKSLLRDFQVFTRYMRLQYIFAYSVGKPHPFHVNQTANRHHNHDWLWKAIWKARSVRLPALLFQTKEVTF